MNTKMLNTVYKEADEMSNDFFVSWRNFLANRPSKDSLAKSMIEETFKKVEPLIKERWVIMEDAYLYDHKIQACWLYEYKEDDSFNKYLDLKIGKNYETDYVDEIKKSTIINKAEDLSPKTN